jgi:hypothetical protein
MQVPRRSPRPQSRCEYADWGRDEVVPQIASQRAPGTCLTLIAGRTGNFACTGFTPTLTVRNVEFKPAE